MNITYYAACLEQIENENKIRAISATCARVLKRIATAKKSKAWRAADRALAASKAL